MPPPPAPTGAWSFEANNRLYHSLTQEQRDTNLQPHLPLTANFSLDYPAICAALGIQSHPILATHTNQYKPPPRPPTPDPTPTPSPSLPEPAQQPTLSPPPSARKAAPSPRPAAGSLAAKAGAKKAELRTPAGKAGRKEEAVVAVVDRREVDEEVKKEEVSVDERDTLCVTHTAIDDGTVAALAIALAVNRHIRCLRLQYSTMTEAGVRMLPAIVSKSCVQMLYIDRITLTPPIDHSAPHPLLVILPALAASNVQLLSLSGNALTDADGAAIASSITNNPVLAALTLSNNHLAARTATALSAALLLNTTLAYLNLSYNPLVSAHLAALLAPLTPTPVDPPPSKPPAKGGAQAEAALYRVQVSKETKTCWREANGSLRQLWCAGCCVGGAGAGGGGGLVERVKEVLAARQTGCGSDGAAEAASVGGVGGGVGQCNVLERLVLECNDWTDCEWSELLAMGPVVSVELVRGSKHVRPSIAPLPTSASTATAAVITAPSDVAAA